MTASTVCPICGATYDATDDQASWDHQLLICEPRGEGDWRRDVMLEDPRSR